VVTSTAFSRRPYQGIELVGLAESDTALSAEMAEQYDLDRNRLYDSPEAELETEFLDAVVVFTHTFSHRRVIEIAASHGADVMVEKPLAVNMEHARAIQTAAETHDVHVLVNYETT
jgi:predicted dehydrogenase